MKNQIHQIQDALRYTRSMLGKVAIDVFAQAQYAAYGIHLLNPSVMDKDANALYEYLEQNDYSSFNASVIHTGILLRTNVSIDSVLCFWRMLDAKTANLFWKVSVEYQNGKSDDHLFDYGAIHPKDYLEDYDQFANFCAKDEDEIFSFLDAASIKKISSTLKQSSNLRNVEIKSIQHQAILDIKNGTVLALYIIDQEIMFCVRRFKESSMAYDSHVYFDLETLVSFYIVQTKEEALMLFNTLSN